MKRSIALILLSVCLLTGLNSSANADEKKQGFSNEAQAGVVLTAGNTETSTIAFRDALTYTIDKNNFLFNANYLTSSNRGVQQAFQWGLGGRYERDLDSTFGVFLGQLLQSDKFQNINQRYATDAGGRKTLQKSENISWFFEFGYRFTRENYPNGFANLNFLRVYHEIEKTWNKGLSGKWWIEYLPNLTNFQGYQFNTEFSISTVLTDIFSLKSAYLVRYNNDPPKGVTQKADSTFTTSLVAKF